MDNALRLSGVGRQVALLVVLWWSLLFVIACNGEPISPVATEEPTGAVSLTAIPEPTPPTGFKPITTEERERLLAALPDEQRTMLELMTLSEWNCIATGLGDQLDIETVAESPELLATLFAEVCDSCIEPTRAADILLGVLEEWGGELSSETRECVREEVRQNHVAYPDSGYRAYAASATTASACFNEAEDLESDISLFAFVLGGPITGSERACLRRLVIDTGVFLYDAVADIGLGRPDHAAFDCFPEERLVEFRIQRLSSRYGFENLAGGELECVTQTFIQAERVRESLDTEESRQSAHSLFDFAATYGCLSSELLNSLPSASGLNSSGGKPDFECLRKLSRETFPELYEEKIGLRMFGNGTDLNPEEYAAVASFASELEECLLPDF